jgi:hypothetical protein
VTSDHRFAYLYGSYGSSAFPVVILALRGTAMVDVTSAFPAVVRSDRAALYRLARRWVARLDRDLRRFGYARSAT